MHRDFPDGFLWGAATSAHQVEGGNTNNDWWDFEHAPATAAGESSGDAIDHFHRYAEDFALLRELGHNAHRLSLTTTNASTTSTGTSRPPPRRSSTASTSAATCTGPRSTTSSGARATARGSA
ncbi:family 1 glycosylhydrolase [Dactylosporangium sp. NPDC005555]|uniref:family 1 glycosylhydrolase n=1 Tax=Dactylosporangium sp. NPDC005555 TaxID=3154889 RepID=UPI00339DB328